MLNHKNELFSLSREIQVSQDYTLAYMTHNPISEQLLRLHFKSEADLKPNDFILTLVAFLTSLEMGTTGPERNKLVMNHLSIALIRIRIGG